MAVVIDPFSFATAELSEDYINFFPNPDIIPTYLAEVSDKTGVFVLADGSCISVKGSWVSLKRVRSFLTELLESYQGNKLDDNKKDTELFDKESPSFSDDVDEDSEDYDQKPESVARFHDTAGEVSDWCKWTSEVLPQIQRTRSKRAWEYSQPKSETNKIPEPLVFYANYQPAPDPAAKVPPTLDAIEKVLKTVYDKDKVKTSDSEPSDESESMPFSMVANDPETSELLNQKKLHNEGIIELNRLSTACETSQDQVQISVSDQNSDHIHKASHSNTRITSKTTYEDQVTQLTQVTAAETATSSAFRDAATGRALSLEKSLQDDLGDMKTDQSDSALVSCGQIKERTKRKSTRRKKGSRNCMDSSRDLESVNSGSGTECSNLDNVQYPVTLVTNNMDLNNSTQEASEVKETKRKGRKRKNKYYQSETPGSEVEASGEILPTRAERAAKRKTLPSVKLKVKAVFPELSSVLNPDKKRGRPGGPKQEFVTKEEEDYVCELCSYVAKKLTHLREHKRRVHITKGKEFKCEECGKVFGFGKDLKRHYLTHQKAENCCDICGKMYKGVRNLAEHKKTHETDYIKPEFPCEFCQKIFSTKYVLAYHIKSEHLGMKKTYLCPTCGKSFSQKNSYLQHANVHIGIKPYQCDICGRSFSYEKSLKEHKYMHQDDKQFECHVCHKKFRQSSGVAIHMKIHKERKDYVCSACGKGFSQKQAMIRHERIHVGDKPFACVLCKRTFTDSSILRRHMILIHKKDKDKWREDTENNVQRRTDFFISVVGKDRILEKVVKRCQGAVDHVVINSKDGPVQSHCDKLVGEPISSVDNNSCHLKETGDINFIPIEFGSVTSLPEPCSSGMVKSFMPAVQPVSLPHLPQYTRVDHEAFSSGTLSSDGIHGPLAAIHPAVPKPESETVLGISHEPTHSVNTSSQTAHVSSEDRTPVSMQEQSPTILNPYTFNDPNCLPSSEFSSSDLQQGGSSGTEVPLPHSSDMVVQDSADYHPDMVMMPEALTTLHFHSGAFSTTSASQSGPAEYNSLLTHPSVQQQQFSNVQHH